MITTTFSRPKLVPTLPSVYRIIREGNTFEIVSDDPLSDRDKEELCLQFTAAQRNKLDELLGSNLENDNNFVSPEIIKGKLINNARVLSSDLYNLPIPNPITANTLFLRCEIVRLIACSDIDSLIDTEIKDRIEALRAKQMDVGVWLYRLPSKWIEFVLY